MSGKDLSRSARLVAFLLFVVLTFVISAGIATGLGFNQRPRALGYVLVGFGLAAAVITVDRWSLALPGIVGIATLNGLITLYSGHALNTAL